MKNKKVMESSEDGHLIHILHPSILISFKSMPAKEQVIDSGISMEPHLPSEIPWKAFFPESFPDSRILGSCEWKHHKYSLLL
jgi:hypothetical protein